MPELATTAAAPYAPEMATKKAAKQGNGPWGKAIQYWFKELHLNPTLVAEGVGMPKNKAGRAARGIDVHMETLRQFAEFFQVDLEWVLVSPEHRLSPELERRVADRIADRAARELHGRPGLTTTVRRVDPRLLAITKRMDRLEAAQQKSVIDLITAFERAKKKTKGGDGGKKRGPRP